MTAAATGRTDRESSKDNIGTQFSDWIPAYPDIRWLAPAVHVTLVVAGCVGKLVINKFFSV